MNGLSRWIVAVVLAALAASGWSGAVWCVSDDHTRLERLGDGCCDGDLHHAGEADAPGLAAGGCGPCLDVAVAAVATAPSSPLVVPAAAVTPGEVISHRSSAPAARPDEPRSAPPLDGTCLRL